MHLYFCFAGEVAGINRLAENVTAGTGCQQHPPAGGIDGAGVEDGRVQPQLILLNVFGDFYTQPVVCIKGEHCFAPGGQTYCSKFRSDHVFIGHSFADHGHVAAAGCFDQTPVDDDAVCAFDSFEGQPAIDEILGVNVQPRSHQAVHVHPCRSAENYSVGIDQDDVAVGVQPAHNLACVVADHAVERQRLTAGLHKLHFLSCVDAERLPVDCHPVGFLVDEMRGTALPEGGTAAHNFSACGCGVGVVAEQCRGNSNGQGAVGWAQGRADIILIHGASPFVAACFALSVLVDCQVGCSLARVGQLVQLCY